MTAHECNIKTAPTPLGIFYTTFNLHVYVEADGNWTAAELCTMYGLSEFNHFDVLTAHY